MVIERTEHFKNRLTHRPELFEIDWTFSDRLKSLPSESQRIPDLLFRENALHTMVEIGLEPDGQPTILASHAS